MASLSPLVFLGNLGGWEIFLILLVVILLFGAKKIPELARGLGRGIREFKDASKDVRREIEDEPRAKNQAPPQGTAEQKAPSSGESNS